MRLEDMKSRDDIGFVLNAMGLTDYGAEIGVAFGENAEKILLHSRLKKLFLIDPWDYVPGQSPVGHGDMIKDWEGCYQYCKEKMKQFPDRSSIYRMASDEASIRFYDRFFDFVYIDANHMSPFIDEDLKLWYPKVKSGGVFGGHDFHEYSNEIYTCNVKTAVDKFFENSGLKIHVVPGEVPSWYVVKP